MTPTEDGAPCPQSLTGRCIRLGVHGEPCAAGECTPNLVAGGEAAEDPPVKGGTRYLVCSGDGALSTTPDRGIAERRAVNTLGWAAALAVICDHTEAPRDV